MDRETLKKVLASYLAALAVLVVLNFALPRLMPGSPTEAIYGEEALCAMSPQMVEELNRRFKLDEPLYEQFWAYVGALARGDLGYSYFYQVPVAKVVASYLPWTALLCGTALVITTVLGFVLGLEAGGRRGSRLDKLLLAGVVTAGGVPDFFAGAVMLIVFGVYWGLAPLGGAVSPYAGYTGLELWADVARHMILPLAALVAVRMPSVFLLARNNTAQAMTEGYILTARGKGCPERTVVYRHAGKSVLLPVITHTGLHFTSLATGALFIEIIFNYPGMGSLLYKAISARDYPLIQGILLTVTAAVLVINLSTDLLYCAVDKRVSLNAR